MPTNEPVSNPNRPHRRRSPVAKVDHRLPHLGTGLPDSPMSDINSHCEQMFKALITAGTFTIVQPSQPHSDIGSDSNVGFAGGPATGSSRDYEVFVSLVLCLSGWGPVTPPVLGSTDCKKLRLIDASGVHVVSFFPDGLRRRPVFLVDPTVRNLMQVGQQTALALIMDSFNAAQHLSVLQSNNPEIIEIVWLRSALQRRADHGGKLITSSSVIDNTDQ
ncbi:hypothetical protein T265_04586 [Opisthorchis viverrini]|uniref:Uncharacterized protein n=1 Tax=Opisthorchis viverrini TaxID=6198 RepID=A0A075AGE0_OPIVI|nr:hypothetical protein T265_04586 [Opisthorchis viverrini]KER28634.1 hypothetical protein T265_04586 [Opisthorchis viverrini]